MICRVLTRSVGSFVHSHVVTATGSTSLLCFVVQRLVGVWSVLRPSDWESAFRAGIEVDHGDFSFGFQSYGLRDEGFFEGCSGKLMLAAPAGRVGSLLVSSNLLSYLHVAAK